VVGPEVNTENTKYIFMPHHQDLAQNHNVKMGSKVFANVAKFKYLGRIVTSQN